MLSKIVSVVFAVLLFTCVASADPIVITGGTVTIVPAGTAQGVKTLPFVLTATNFSANISGTAGTYGLKLCSPIPGDHPPCTSVSAGWQASGSDIFGSFTLNGTTHPTDVFNQLVLQFGVALVAIPPELQNASGVMIVAPFSFTGLAHPFLGDTVDLTGEGTVTVFLVNRTSGQFSGLFLDQAIYTFGATPQQVTVTATPEPTTILLLVSGLAGAGVWRRSRRRTWR
jgi:PEP-CTERM motif-containing protein